jgi:spermidine/putrescine transport system ATP-binding protein
MADVRFEQATRVYPGSETPAVDRLDLHIEDAEFVVLVGPSGSGKTTALRMLAGLEEVDAGAVFIGDRDVTDVAPKDRDVAMVFQNYALYPYLTVAANMAFPLKIGGVKKAERERRAAAMLERVGLAGALHKRVDELSGGQRQRVAIARSLVLEPTLLLLDEPLGALDLKLREHMKIELKQLQAAFGTTFVYITHDQSEALVLSDHVAVMNRGRFEQIGTPQQLYYEPASAFVASFVGANNRIQGRAVGVDGELVELATAQGWVIRARRHGAIAAGDTVAAFVRPEAASLELEAERLGEPMVRYAGEVQSVLFDGANSAVLLVEQQSRFEFRAALPQTGRLEDLKVGARVFFGFDPQRAICFGAAASTGHDHG